MKGSKSCSDLGSWSIDDWVFGACSHELTSSILAEIPKL